jgi:hypothetical protein
MRIHTLITSIVAAGSLALIAACSGATTSDVEGDLPEDFDDSAAALAVEPEPDDSLSDDDDDRDDNGDHHKDKDKEKREGKHKKKHRHHHLFKKLDRLDGDKNGAIVIASLPARVPPRVLEKLHEIDTNDDGIVTRAESHEHCFAKHHDWRH